MGKREDQYADLNETAYAAYRAVKAAEGEVALPFEVWRHWAVSLRQIRAAALNRQHSI